MRGASGLAGAANVDVLRELHYPIVYLYYTSTDSAFHTPHCQIVHHTFKAGKAEAWWAEATKRMGDTAGYGEALSH